MFTTLIVFQVVVAAGLIAIVLVQRGPGATMGAAFGAGASGTVFGSRGAGNFLTRTTSWLAVGFFGISLALAVIATSLSSGGASESVLAGSVMEQQSESAGAGEPANDQAGIESAIDELDNPPAEQTEADAGEGVQESEADAAAPSEENGGGLPVPPEGN